MKENPFSMFHMDDVSSSHIEKTDFQDTPWFMLMINKHVMLLYMNFTLGYNHIYTTQDAEKRTEEIRISFY